LVDAGNSTAASRRRSAFFIEVTLKGLAGLSSGVNDLLKNKVFGYSQTKENSASLGVAR
jgi:LPS-assembly protein